MYIWAKPLQKVITLTKLILTYTTFLVSFFWGRYIKPGEPSYTVQGRALALGAVTPQPLRNSQSGDKK